MKIQNRDIRLYARANDVPLWKIAKAMNISEPTMTRRLRQDLSNIEKEKIRSIIDNLKAGEINAE